jgi:hypothetical protein
METTEPKRRWFRYSLRTLLVLVTLSAVAIGWYTYRQRIINAERSKLLGTWKYGVQWGNGWTYDGNPFELSDSDFEVGMPSGGIGKIDFHFTGGSKSLAIYRFKGNILEVAQNIAGAPRPNSFDRENLNFVWTAKRADSTSEMRRYP